MALFYPHDSTVTLKTLNLPEIYPASASTASFWKDPCPDPLFALRPLRSLRGRALAPLSSEKKVVERLGFFRGSARFKHQK